MPCIRSIKTIRHTNPSITSVRRSPRHHPVVGTDPYGFLAKFSRVVDQDDPLRRLYLCPDIATHYLQRLDWPSLMAFAIGSWFATALAQEEAKRRIRRLLTPWFTPDDFIPLMELMERCDAAFVGRLVRRFLQLNSMAEVLVRHAGFDEPEDTLHILVPKEHRPAFVEGMKRIGYTWSERGSNRGPRLGGSTPIHTFGYLSAMNKEEVGHLSMIAVDVCDRGIIEGVLNGRMSIDMNAITANRVYCVFPSAIVSNDSLHSDAERYSSPPRVTGEGYRVAMNNGRMKNKCGLECPGVERVIGQDKGIGVFQWKAGSTSPYSSREEDEVLSRDYILFRFLEHCHNPRCRNGLPSHKRRI